MTGYICCFSNASMPCILYVVASDDTPAQCLMDINRSILPTPYRYALVKEVANPFDKERALRNDQNTQSDDLTPGFYRTLIKVRAYMDGEMLE